MHIERNNHLINFYVTSLFFVQIYMIWTSQFRIIYLVLLSQNGQSSIPSHYFQKETQSTITSLSSILLF